MGGISSDTEESQPSLQSANEKNSEMTPSPSPPVHAPGEKRHGLVMPPHYYYLSIYLYTLHAKPPLCTTAFRPFQGFGLLGAYTAILTLPPLPKPRLQYGLQNIYSLARPGGSARLPSPLIIVVPAALGADTEKRL